MFPAANSQQRLSVTKSNEKSKKVPLPPGRSLMDWIRLTKSGRDLKGTGPRILQITEEELARHNRTDDLWLAIRGMVYNVTSYIAYHPGGADELMRGAGKDATSLFEEVHRWVNYESMLKECLVGKLIESSGSKNTAPSSSMLAPPTLNSSNLDPLGVNKLKLAPPSSNSNTPKIMVEDVTPQSLSVSPLSDKNVEPNHDWYQNDECVYFVLYCKTSTLTKKQLICDVREKRVFLDVIFNDLVHSYKIELYGAVAPAVDLTLTKSGKAQLSLKKTVQGQRWQSLGNIEHAVSNFFSQDMSKIRFCECTIVDKMPLTHDTSLYKISLPESRWLSVPIGYHVYLKAVVEGLEVLKPYTPVIPSLTEPKCTMNSNQNLYLAIKHYDMGVVTSTLKRSKAGDKMLVSTCDGDFDFARFSNAETYVMLAAGTGITPMIRLVHSLLHNKELPCVHLVFFNKTEDDIIWKNEFEELQNMFPSRLHVLHVLSRPDESWNGQRGRISHELIKNYVDRYNLVVDRTAVMVCGPKDFSKLGMELTSNMGFCITHEFK